MTDDTFLEVRKMFFRLRDQGVTVRAIAKMTQHLSYGDVSRILKGIEPKEPEKRRELGLSVELPAPVCPVHGVVHVGRCPGKGRKYRDLFAMPAASLRRAIEGRE